MTKTEYDPQEFPLFPAGQGWTIASIVLGSLSLLDAGGLYLMPSPYALVFGPGIFFPFLFLAGCITGGVSINKASKTHVSTRTTWVARMGLFLVLLSLVLFMFWFSYLNALCQRSPMGCA